jgi:DNA-binding NarL/FixJ family response regulator
MILTAHIDLEHILALFKAGARGYMLKDEALGTIAAAVRAVASGETWMSAAIMECLVDHAASELADEPGLSVRESEVLRQLVTGKENREIGVALHISERTVRFHLRNIYDKLGVQRRAEAIAWGVRRGLGTGGAPGSSAKALRASPLAGEAAGDPFGGRRF